jgi:hypothetical protein
MVFVRGDELALLISSLCVLFELVGWFAFVFGFICGLDFSACMVASGFSLLDLVV